MTADAGAPPFGAAGRIGVIVPANNATLEPELWSRVPPGVAVYATRILARGDLTPEAVRQMEREVDRAVDELCATGVDVLLIADMVTTFIMEPGWNDTRTRGVTERTGVPCVSAWTALAAALSALGARRLALGTPYPRAIHALTRPFFEREGFALTADGTLDILAMSEVPRVPPERIRTLVASLDRRAADAVVLLATDLPTFSIIESLESEIGLPVLTSNQALLWRALRVCRNPAAVPGLGRLFAR
ncbi:MAG: maleate cis-trans isomerase family protein [Candidatus Rokuibacteriota bacterium]